MKKRISTAVAVSFSSLALIFTLGTSQAMVNSELERLNQAIVAILAPFNTPETKLSFAVSKADLNATRVVGFGGTLDYSKDLGDERKASAKASASYEFPEGSDAVPLVQLDAGIKIDMLKLTTQKEFNEFGAQIPDLLEGFAAQIKSQMGSNVTDVSLKTKTDTSEGNLKKLTVSLKVNVNLAGLSEAELKLVPIAKAELSGALTPTGVDFAANIVMNANYKGFDQDNDGLREYLLGLLAQDKSKLDEIRNTMKTIDDFFTDAIKQKD